MSLWQFELIRILPLLILFGYAAYSDHKTGEVSNKVWLYTPIGFALTLLEVYLYTPSLAVFAFSVMGVIAALSLGLFFFSKGLIGGADSKALLCLSLCLPLSPSFCVYIGIYPLVAFALAAFTVTAKSILINKSFNLVKVKVRFLPYLFVGMLLALV